MIRQRFPGFEQNDYVPESNADNRPIHGLMTEFTNVRASTVDLFTSFTSEMKERDGSFKQSRNVC